jgi:hypothetical protein
MYSRDFVKGVEIADKCILAGARRAWSDLMLFESELDKDNNDMMDGYNHRWSQALNHLGGDTSVLDAILDYLDENKKKGRN